MLTTTAAAQVLESLCLPKTPGTDGEDVLVLARDSRGEVSFAAVIDGVTDKSGRTYWSTTGGRLAADAVARVLTQLPADADARHAVDAFTEAVAQLRTRFGVPAGDPTPPAAGFTALSVSRREIWRVGDANIAWTSSSGRVHHAGETELDKSAATVRAVCLHALLQAGSTVEELLAEDAGREVIMPMLKVQGLLANRDLPDPLGYGVIDGTPVPDRHVHVFPLPTGTCEVVLATDGYLSAAATLADAEEELQQSLADDPLRINEHRATKAVQPGATSFDDRTYLRLALAAA